MMFLGAAWRARLLRVALVVLTLAVAGCGTVAKEPPLTAIVWNETDRPINVTVELEATATEGQVFRHSVNGVVLAESHRTLYSALAGEFATPASLAIRVNATGFQDKAAFVELAPVYSGPWLIEIALDHAGITIDAVRVYP